MRGVLGGRGAAVELPGLQGELGEVLVALEVDLGS